MDFLRFFYSLESDGDRSHEVASASRQLALSQRPGMHQTIEDPDGILFTSADRKLLCQMGICPAIRGAAHCPADNSQVDCERETMVASVSRNAASQRGS
jgi:hypothetical protein